MRNHKKEQQASNNDAQKTLPLHKADKQLLWSEVDNLQEEFKCAPHPAQAQFLAFKIWQFEQDHGIIRTIGDAIDHILTEVDAMMESNDIGTRQEHRARIEHLAVTLPMFLHILENPALFSYHR